MPFPKIPKEITEKLNAMSNKELDALAKLMHVSFLNEEKDASEKAFMLSTEPVKNIRDALKMMNSKKIYRFTTNGEGVFSAGKRLLPENLVTEVLARKKWLVKPTLPEGEYRFYLTEKGREKYEKTLFLSHKKYLPNIKLEAADTKALKDIAYEDENQVVEKVKPATKKMSLPQLKKDKYSEAHGGYSRLFELRCRKCNTVLTLYQKDDPKNVVGSLRRLYLDRFIPAKTKTPSILTCNKCKEPLGTLYTYQKERRKAYRLYQDAIVKRRPS